MCLAKSILAISGVLPERLASLNFLCPYPVPSYAIGQRSSPASSSAARTRSALRLRLRRSGLRDARGDLLLYKRHPSKTSARAAQSMCTRIATFNLDSGEVKKTVLSVKTCTVEQTSTGNVLFFQAQRWFYRGDMNLPAPGN